MYNFIKARRASETIEIAFSIIATLCILFLVLNMFSDNIKTFIDHGGFPSTWNSSAQKTSDQSWKIGQNQLTREEITTPEVQATSWDAILQNHNDKAIRNINNYYTQVQSAGGSDKYQLPDGDKKLLAMWLAIYANSTSAKQEVGAGWEALDKTKIEKTSYSYDDFAYAQGIDTSGITNGWIEIVGQPRISWNDPIKNPTNWKIGITTSESNSEERVSNIRGEGGIIKACDNN